MSTNGRTWGWRLCSASFLAIGEVIASFGDCAHAQINPDGTLGAESSVVTPLAPGSTVDVIQGGATRGTNLFHSFEQFSVPTGGTAFFNNAADIRNIISRVTGGSVSNINGLIRANGTANLFLLNPNGIIFGPNAQLNIGGSIVASTASSLNFADGNQFSATAHPTTPLLTVSVPIGLQFGGNAGSIRNQSQATISDDFGYETTVGLNVQPGKTLALVGGGVALEGGVLTAEEGRIELGSVGSPSLVSLTPTEQGWTLGYEGVQNFQDIQLSQGVFVSNGYELPQKAFVAGDNTQVRGRQVTLNDYSMIDSTNLAMTASESVAVRDSSLSAGDLTITTGKLIVQDRASVSTYASEGSGGNLTVTAPESVEVIGTDADGFPSRLSTHDGGNLTITTGKLIVRDGASVSTYAPYGGPTSPFGGLGGGNLTVTAEESVKVIGTDANENPSSLFTYTSGALPKYQPIAGSAGILTIETRQLNVQDRAQVVTSTSDAGNAGDLIVRASGSVEVSGGGRILAQTEPGSTGSGGNLTIETKRLEGTQLVVRSFGQGPAGQLTVITPAPLPNLAKQIIPDKTLPTSSTVRSDFNTSIIEGGTQVGSNLFHSFAQFSLPTLNTAYFNNALDVQNIIARVTGESVSEIDGQIQSNGNANLFLLNPNGIIFGRDAFLNIGGSFLASTASSLNFADGTQFSTTEHPKTPPLTMSVPIDLQFRGAAGSILNQSRVSSSFSPELGLRVQPGETLALVGGDVRLDGGNLQAPGGRVELGGVAGTGTVGLQVNGNNLGLSFPDSVTRAEVSLTNSSYVDVTAGGGGSIAINARNLDVSGGSNLLAGIGEGLGTVGSQAGDITLNATEMITISNSSSITNNQFGATGSPGNISVYANGSVSLVDSFISSILFDGEGNTGNISMQTNGSVSLVDSSIITLNYFGEENTGNISVQANGSVSLVHSGISTTTFGQGNSGDITVQTDALRLLDGARLTATTRGEGNGGIITVNVNTLEITGGGQLLTAAFESGDAGSITVNAIDSITLSGSDPDLLAELDDLNGFGLVSFASGLFANTTENSSGQGGSIRVETGTLNVRDGAEVNVSSAGAGAAGDLTVSADSIDLDNQGSILATTAVGNQGNITLRSGDLVLRRESFITTSATGIASGGNITIDTDVLVALENSDISANALEGRGGNVQINTQGLFLSPDSQITASSERGINGVVEINTADIDPSSALATLPAELVDAAGLIAQGCLGGGGTVGRGVSEFIITGRGGVPPTPREALASEPPLADLGMPIQGGENRASAAIPINPTSSEPAPIVEAQGWVTNAKGEVVLTATAPTVTPHNPWMTPASCHKPETSS